MDFDRYAARGVTAHPLLLGRELSQAPAPGRTFTSENPMSYDHLDSEELLYVALNAMNHDRHGEALVLLKTLVEREPGLANGRYLLAAQHAQLGMFERAEAGFRDLLTAVPDLPMARFQLGQLLLMRDAREDVETVLAPLVAGDDALSAYARALCRLSAQDESGALHELESGLASPQQMPSLAADMQNLHERLSQSRAPTPAATAANESEAVPRMFMTGYGRGG